MSIDLGKLISTSQDFSLERLEILTVITRVVPIFYSSLKHVMHFYYPSKAILQILFLKIGLVFFHMFKLELQTLRVVLLLLVNQYFKSIETRVNQCIDQLQNVFLRQLFWISYQLHQLILRQDMSPHFRRRLLRSYTQYLA